MSKNLAKKVQILSPEPLSPLSTWHIDDVRALRDVFDTIEAVAEDIRNCRPRCPEFSFLVMAAAFARPAIQKVWDGPYLLRSNKR